MAELLFLAHRIPYPPDKGDKIRSWHVLRHLARTHDVHLGCFVDDPDDWRHEGILRELCGECLFLPFHPRRARIRGLAAFVDGGPLTLRCYRDRRLADWVENLRRRRRIDRIYVFSSAMAQYVLDDGAGRRVIDFVDVDSDKWRQYAANKSGPAAWVYAREARRLLAYERRVARAFDASLFVSPAEAELFRALAPESAGRVQSLANGVDIDFFSPEHAFDDPFGGDRDAIVFTGAMDYWANVDAVTWFADAVLPLVRERHPEARFRIVGSKPAAEVRRLARRPGIEVTGRVPDVRPHVAHATLAVAPMRIARGVQNKVLEAMAMGRAVVTTPQGLEGIAAEAGREIVVAEEAAAFADAVCDLLAGADAAAEIGRRARARVVGSYSWGATLTPLDGLLDGASDRRRAVA